MTPYCVAANWKMNGRQDLLKAWLQGFAEGFHQINNETSSVPSVLEDASIVLSLPAPYISLAKKLCTDLGIDGQISIGSQDVSRFEQDGAYTGEVSASMLRDVGCDWAIIGHSERRHLMGEDNEICAIKFEQALAAGLLPIFCVGETLAARESAQFWDTIKQQLVAIEASLKKYQQSFSIAYEPVWAIGTGQNATSEQVQAVHNMIQEYLVELLGDAARQVPIIYGGSVKSSNAQPIFAQESVKGGLIGGASLKVGSFLDIVTAFQKAKDNEAGSGPLG